MTRVTIFVFFLVLFVIVLNLRDQQGLTVSNTYFDFDQYEESYLAEKNLIHELANPVEEHNHEEMMAEMDQPKEESKFIVTTNAEVRNGVYQVKMLNKGANGEKMVFEPILLKINKGDKVTFIPVDKGHMSQTISKGIPLGAAEFESKVNEEYTQTFNTPGVHAIKCNPHFTMGMVAMVVVGDNPENISQMENLKIKGNKGKKRWEAMLTELRKMNQ